MAIKIIKKGKDVSKPVVKRVICPHCHSLLEYTSKDVLRSRSGDDGESIEYIACPNCRLSFVIE